MNKEEEALTAMLDAFEAGITQARRILNAVDPQNPVGSNPTKEAKRGFEYDPEKIGWAPATGERGPYQLAKASENMDNVNFALLKKALEENKGPLWGKVYFYWHLDKLDGIGRKPVSEVKRGTRKS